MDPLLITISVVFIFVSFCVGYKYGVAQGRAEGNCEGWNNATRYQVRAGTAPPRPPDYLDPGIRSCDVGKRRKK